jgi:ABC-type nickel/cobalt efflux system permease component RcnA
MLSQIGFVVLALLTLVALFGFFITRGTTLKRIGLVVFAIMSLFASLAFIIAALGAYGAIRRGAGDLGAWLGDCALSLVILIVLGASVWGLARSLKRDRVGS